MCEICDLLIKVVVFEWKHLLGFEGDFNVTGKVAGIDREITFLQDGEEIYADITHEDAKSWYRASQMEPTLAWARCGNGWNSVRVIAYERSTTYLDALTIEPDEPIRQTFEQQEHLRKQIWSKLPEGLYDEFQEKPVMKQNVPSGFQLFRRKSRLPLKKAALLWKCLCSEKKQMFNNAAQLFTSETTI